MAIDSLDIVPFNNSSELYVNIPGSKSISNRALILSVLNKNDVKINGLLKSDDVEIMITALKKLGVIINEYDNIVEIKGTGGELVKKSASINVGNAGTVARFLTALLALQKEGQYHLDGSEAMRKRPMKGLIEALEIHGCKFDFQEKEYHFPFIINCNGLNSHDWVIDASMSSQILSAILMIAPYINGKKYIQLTGTTVSRPFVEMTIEMMSQFAPVESRNEIKQQRNKYLIGCFDYELNDGTYFIEPDATAASYYLSLPIATKGVVKIDNLQRIVLQGDINYCKILSTCGISINYTSDCIEASFKKPVVGGSYDFNDISDTFLTLAALSPLLNTPLKISGIGHTRNQETDRVSGMATELKKLLFSVEEQEDSLHLFPHENLNKFIRGDKISIETYDDHRFAMSFSILGSHDLFKNQKPWIQIINPMCCTKTFPLFYQELDKCRLNAE